MTEDLAGCLRDAGIPVVTRDRPAGVAETRFQAMASTLIYGAKDAVLVDAFLTTEQSAALADWIASKNKNLIAIYITHGHGDHWFGAATILDRFPKWRDGATRSTVEVMRQNASPAALDGAWKPSFPGQIPERRVIADELEGNVIELEGREPVAVELGHTDTDSTTCLHVPSIGLIVAGDAAYNDVHLYLAESNAQSLQAWIAALELLSPFIRARSWRRTSGRRTTIVRRSSTRPGDISVTSIGSQRRRSPAQEFHDEMLALCSESGQSGVGRSGVLRAAKP